MPVRTMVWGFAALLASGLFSWGAVASAAASEVVVEVRASDQADAPVVEHYKLYGASHALVIGIDNYTGGWPRLSNAIKDAQLVGAALQDQGFDVDLLIDPDGETLRRRLREFYGIKGRDPEARLFVWYAGHGHTEFGEGYLVPADAPLPDHEQFLVKALHMGDVGSMVRIARAKHALAVFDSCFAGTVFTAQRARPPAAITKAVVQPVRQFLTSGDADQQVSDDGTFRKLFIAALKGEEAADLNRDGYLTGSELGLYLEDRVTNLTQAAQTPRSGKLRDQRFDRGDFVFLMPLAEPAVAALPKTPTPPAPDKDESAFELAFWDTIKSSQNAADYQAYLEVYPQGKFAPLAKARANALRGAVQEKAEEKAADQAATAALQEQLAQQSAAQEALRQQLEEQQRQQAELQAKLAQQAAKPALSAGSEQQANLPSPSAPPLKTRQAVEAYIDDNEHRMERLLAKYTSQHRLLQVGSTRKQVEIHDWAVTGLEGDKVKATIAYSYGAIKGGFNMATGTFAFEMTWVDDELEITRHKRVD